MPASKGFAKNSLGRILKDSVFQRETDAQAMNSGGNHQSEVDDLLVEKCSSDDKESGSSEEGDQLVNQVSGHVGLRNAIACYLIGYQLEKKSEKLVEPDIHGGGDFFPQDSKKCSILVTL